MLAFIVAPLDEEQRLVADTVIADVLRVRHAAPALGSWCRASEFR
jgi:hypothetical protein